eukprot:Hpha_TRINITY_DN22559_c0_g1::TRINITY_DN22559_c0_g1_i1::g.185018::m.185018
MGDDEGSLRRPSATGLPRASTSVLGWNRKDDPAEPQFDPNARRNSTLARSQRAGGSRVVSPNSSGMGASFLSGTPALSGSGAAAPAAAAPPAARETTPPSGPKGRENILIPPTALGRRDGAPTTPPPRMVRKESAFGGSTATPRTTTERKREPSFHIPNAESVKTHTIPPPDPRPVPS